MIEKGRWKGQDSIVLENDRLRAVLLPGWGAKTVSLFHKATGIETLWQNPRAEFTTTSYGAPYGEGEFAGFDEMFPTISRCFYEAEPWAGTEMPDHGELWTVPWETVIDGDSVSFGVGGIRLPYRLSKKLSLRGESLVADYKASNDSDHPMDFIWAAHPLFNASEGMRFIVPRGMDWVINAVPGPTLGAYGERLGFPLAHPAGGGELCLDRMPARNGSGWQKYWFADRVTEGWCLLRDDARSLNIGMAFPRERVPYLGMWLNEGGYAGQYNIAPEPATAAMDRIDFARMWGRGSQLPARGSLSWRLVISVAEGKTPISLREDGEFMY